LASITATLTKNKTSSNIKITFSFISISPSQLPPMQFPLLYLMARWPPGCSQSAMRPPLQIDGHYLLQSSYI
jgi:hypothetical protein